MLKNCLDVNQPWACEEINSSFFSIYKSTLPATWTAIFQNSICQPVLGLSCVPESMLPILTRTESISVDRCDIELHLLFESLFLLL